MSTSNVLHVELSENERGEVLGFTGKTPEQLQQEILDALLGWCNRHHERLEHVMLSANGPVLHCTVGTKPPFDFALCDHLSDLDIQWAQSGWTVTSHLIPLLTDEDTEATALARMRDFMEFADACDQEDELGLSVPFINAEQWDERSDALWRAQQALGCTREGEEFLEE
jgi:hypothetical protein